MKVVEMEGIMEVHFGYLDLNSMLKYKMFGCKSNIMQYNKLLLKNVTLLLRKKVNEKFKIIFKYMESNGILIYNI